jgi:hypothetical protein
MKITKEQLRKIIKEEMGSSFIMEDPANPNFIQTYKKLIRELKQVALTAKE